VVPNFALNKAVPHGFEQSCSAMAAIGDAKVGRKGTATRRGFKVTQNWRQEPIKGALGKAYEQVPALICESCARRILRASSHFGGGFCSLQGAKGKKNFREKKPDFD